MRRPYVYLINIGAAFGLLAAKFDSRRVFHYPESNPIYRQSSPHQCAICDDSNCLKMDNALCAYHRETDELLKEEETDLTNDNTALKAEVDGLLFELTEQESIAAGECIPYISHYTDCHKRNMCLGCRKCDCDAGGRWNCLDTQRCRADATLKVDHRALVGVIKDLNMSQIDTHVRKKRSRNETSVTKVEEREEGLTSQEIMSLINGPNRSIPPVINVTGNPKNITNDIDDPMFDNEWDSATESIESTMLITTERKETQNESDLDFDELFPAQESTGHNNSTRIHLPMLKKHTEDILDLDYMDNPEGNTTQSNDLNKTVENMLGSEEKVSKEFSQNSTRKDEKNMIFYTSLNQGLNELTTFGGSTKEYGIPDISETNDIFDRQTVHVVKREISNVITYSETTPSLNNYNKSIQSFKENVLDPLSHIIHDKRNELRQLDRMRKNLMKFMKTYQQNENYSNFSLDMYDNSSKSYLTVNKIVFASNFDGDNVKTKIPTYVDEPVSKLKNDISEVITDIIRIQNRTNFKSLPDDLKVLIRAMKYYVHEQGKRHIQKEIEKISKKVSRKSFTVNTNKILQSQSTDVLKQMLIAIDKDMPQTNALAPLSLSAHKIMMRVIKKYHRDDSTQSNFRIFDSNAKITEMLRNIGIKWYKMTRNVASSPFSDRLFNMKLLHLEIMRDICKIDDALSLIKSLRRRNAFITDDPMIGKLSSRITEDIDIISRKIKEIFELQNGNIARDTSIQTKMKLKAKKDSFMQQLKKILKHTKKDIKKMLKDKIKYGNKQFVHKGDMQKNYMNATFIRRKRSSVKFSNVMNRIRNIIPNYLKGKVNDARNSKLTKTKH